MAAWAELAGPGSVDDSSAASRLGGPALVTTAYADRPVSKARTLSYPTLPQLFSTRSIAKTFRRAAYVAK